MRAWSVGIMTQCEQGTGLASMFVLASTRGEAIAAAVRTVIDAHEPAHHPVSIGGTTANEIDPEVIIAAAAALARMEPC